MSTRAIGASLLLAGLLAGSVPHEAHGQGWSVDLSAGRIVYDPVSVNIGTSNVVGSLRYDARRDAWVYGTAAAPLREPDPLWGAFGGGGRFLLPGSEGRRATLGIELGADGFLFRDAVADQIGSGGIFAAMPFTRLSAGAGRVEVRGGWRGQTLSFAGDTENRRVFETGARVSYDAALRVQADARWVRASEGTYPFVGASLQYGGSPLQIWAQGGKWFSDDLKDVTWGAGAGVALGGRATLWASVRQEAPDPLYWNAARRTWSVGVTRRLSRAPAVMLPTPPAQAGNVVIRVPARDSPGELSIAGDFNNWQPVPMQREGREWVMRLPLAAGVYHYAFRSATGEWFVPASIAGRRDDDMGGYVAVLVVL